MLTAMCSICELLSEMRFRWFHRPLVMPDYQSRCLGQSDVAIKVQHLSSVEKSGGSRAPAHACISEQATAMTVLILVVRSDA